MEAQQTSSPTLTTRESVSPYLSRKLSVLSFVAMVCVVFIHAYNYTDTFLQPTTMISEGFHPGAMVQFLISNALARFATPLFFCHIGLFVFCRVSQAYLQGLFGQVG